MTPTGSSSFAEWCDAIAAETFAPAGGSAAALAAALAASLGEMVAKLTVSRDDLRDVHDEARELAARAERLRRELTDLAERDAVVYARVAAAAPSAATLPDERERRRAQRDEALAVGAEVQFEVLVRAREAAAVALRAAELGPRGALPDAATAIFLAGAVARAAYWNVRANLRARRGDDERSSLVGAALATLERVEAVEWEIKLALNERVA